jgi:hypothetical protein
LNNHPLLQPVVALLAWTAIMFLWMYAIRIPAMIEAGVDLKNRVGGQGSDLDKILPPDVQWKAHNYNHLMEQPTLFYAICFSLALIEQGDGPNLLLAWSYVALRVVHSIVQATWNLVRVRFAIFALASVALIALTLHAAAALLHA